MSRINIIGKPEMEATALINRVKELAKIQETKIDDTLLNVISMYYIISPKRGGLNPIIPIADCINISNFLTDQSALENRNPAKLGSEVGGEILKCQTWVEGITLHVDRLASSIKAEGFPRKDTPDKDSNIIYGIGFPSYKLDKITEIIVYDLLGIEYTGTDSSEISTITDDSLVAIMSEKGYISDIEYWKKVLLTNTQVPSSNIRSLFSKIAMKK